MRLIQNERRLLKYLVQNARLTDTACSEKLKISTQAVGKMRKKLENTGFIKRYTAQLNHDALGIKVFSVTLLRLSPMGWQYYKQPDKLQKELSKNLVMLIQPQQGAITHIAVHAFRDLNELDHYFQVFNSHFSKLIEVRGIWSFSATSILKNSFNPIFNKVLNEYGSDQQVLPSFCMPVKKRDLGDFGFARQFELTKLTDNEKLVLTSLLKNGRVSDASISRRIGISTRAVGKIRMKLEKTGLINGYHTELDFENIGLNVFAVLMLKEKEAAWEKFPDGGIMPFIQSCDNITHCFQTPDGGVTKILFCMFRNLRECDLFVKQMQSDFNSFFDLNSIYVAPHTALVKNDISDISSGVLNEFGQEKLNLPIPCISLVDNACEGLAVTN